MKKPMIVLLRNLNNVRLDRNVYLSRRIVFEELIPNRLILGGLRPTELQEESNEHITFINTN